MSPAPASPSVGSLPPNATLQALYPAGGASVTVDGSGVAVLPLDAKAVTVWAVVP